MKEPTGIRYGGADKRGLTLIELLVFFVMGTLALLGAIIVYERIGGLSSTLLGGLGGCLVLPALAAIYGLILSLVRDGIPYRPRCRNGCCRGSDYKARRFGDKIDLECKCGDRYTRRGRRFLHVNDEGQEIPHLMWRPFRGWFPDETEQ